MPEAWRPTRLQEYIGQKGLITLLADEIAAAKSARRALCHMLFSGLPGLGKTTIVHLLAAELGQLPPIKMIGRSVTEQSLQDLFITQLNTAGYDETGKVVDRDKIRPRIVLLDEVEEMPTALFELLHTVLEPDEHGRRIFGVKMTSRLKAVLPKVKTDRVDCWVPEVTFIFATNYLGKLRKKADAALDRMGIKWNFEPYSNDELSLIVLQYAAQRGIDITEDACVAIADRSMGAPRKAINFVDRTLARLTANQSRGSDNKTITEDVVEETMGILGIDDKGLTKQCRDYLKRLTMVGGKMALPSISAALGIDEKTITTEVEPFLIRLGFVNIVGGGRQITDLGIEHIEGHHLNPMLGRIIQ